MNLGEHLLRYQIVLLSRNFVTRSFCSVKTSLPDRFAQSKLRYQIVLLSWNFVTRSFCSVETSLPDRFAQSKLRYLIVLLSRNFVTRSFCSVETSLPDRFAQSKHTFLYRSFPIKNNKNNTYLFRRTECLFDVWYSTPHFTCA